ncbi:MAG TPA: ABZJ_00895 family protein [Alphaproteobacteria bacterium]|nr:ABZJ_00895 family protein [Alphaproteobacteria bacterium]
MDTPVKKYLFRFALIYVVLLVALAILETFLDKENSMLQMLVIMVSGIMVSDKFTKDNMRTPNKLEKRGLVFGSFALANLISGILFALIYALANAEGQKAFIELLQRIPLPVFSGIIIIVCLLQVLLLSYIYDGMAKKTLEAHQKRTAKEVAK